MGRLPLAQVTEHEDSTMTILVDGEMFVSGPIERAALGRMLSAIAEQHASPVRVELTDTAGRVFADILHPRRRAARPSPRPCPRRPHCRNPWRRLPRQSPPCGQ